MQKELKLGTWKIEAKLDEKSDVLWVRINPGKGRSVIAIETDNGSVGEWDWVPHTRNESMIDSYCTRPFDDVKAMGEDPEFARQMKATRPMAAKKLTELARGGSGLKR